MKEKTKNMVARIFMLVMAMVLLCTSAFASEIDVKEIDVTNIVASGGEVSLDVTNGTATGVNVTLIVVRQEEDTKKILETDSDNNENVAIGASETVSFSASVTAPAEGEEVAYYVWEETGRIPIKNNAPSEPVDFEADGTKMNELTLSWTASDDDKADLTKYKLYRWDSFYNEFKTIDVDKAATSYADKNLAHGEKVSYKLEAIDGEGAKSEIMEASGTTRVPYSVSFEAEGDLGVKLTNAVNSKGLEFYDASKSNQQYYYPVYTGKATGRNCALTITRDRGSNTWITGLIGFNITQPDEVIEATDEDSATPEDKFYQDVVVEVTYFDAGPTHIGVRHNGVNSKGEYAVTGMTNHKYHALTNTGVWKKKALTLKNMYPFNRTVAPQNKGEGYINFEVYAGKNGSMSSGLLVSKVSATAAAYYQKEPAYLKVGKGIETFDMLFYPDFELMMDGTKKEGIEDFPYTEVYYAEATSKLTQMEGKECLGMDSYEIKMDDDNKLKGKSNVTFEVIYLDNGTGAQIEYCKVGGGTATVSLPAFENDNKWKKATISVSDALLNGSITGAQDRSIDFVVESTDGEPLYITQIRAY